MWPHWSLLHNAAVSNYVFKKHPPPSFGDLKHSNVWVGSGATEQKKIVEDPLLLICFRHVDLLQIYIRKMHGVSTV